MNRWYLAAAIPLLLGAIAVAQANLVQFKTSSGCATVNFTTPGDFTWTADCTATVTWEAWGGGAAGSGTGGSGNGGGAGAYSKGLIAVTNGTSYNVHVAVGATGGPAGAGNGKTSYICPTAEALCTGNPDACLSGGTLSTSNHVCATRGLGVGTGGQASDGVGNDTKTDGGAGAAGGAGSGGIGGGGGGAGGKDGNGVAGTIGGAGGGNGGAGDNGSGGAGGTSGGAGAANALGGGGGGGISAGPAGDGGVPGGAGGAAWNSGNGGSGGGGKIKISP